jgi:hypothetical protein
MSETEHTDRSSRLGASHYSSGDFQDKVRRQSGTTQARHTVSMLLHMLAAIILMLFAASHFAFLTIHNLDHKLQNPVFPFLSNGTTYAFAGVLEFTTALVCLGWRGKGPANVVILIFVGVILWYRWAFHYTGGAECNCLGYLGRLLHINKSAERIIPMLALLFLGMTTLPWLRCLFARVTPKRVGCLMVLSILTLSVVRVRAEQTIEVQGLIDVTVWDPQHNHEHAHTHSRGRFLAAISDHKWTISATNLENNVYWARLAYDGTNSYASEPYGGNLWFNILPQSNTVSTSICPGPFFFPEDGDWLGLAVIWTTYCLSSETIAYATTNGVTTIPAPWWAPRISEQGYGYKWVINPANDEFAEDLKVVRDISLDLAPNQELLRWDLNYPEKVGDRNGLNQDLAIRTLRQNGFVDASYHCTDWYQTNGMSIPRASEFYCYTLNAMTRKPYPFPSYKGYLTTDEVTLLGDTDPGLPPPSRGTLVRDYRFKRMNKTRVYNYAQYRLEVGDAWRPDRDPSLLAQAEEGLKNGTRIGAIATPRNILVWLFLLVLLSAPVALYHLVERKQKTNKQKEIISV